MSKLNTYISESKIHGKGVFSMHKIKKDEFIFDVGNTSNSKDNGAIVLNRSARYLNHSSEPNCLILGIESRLKNKKYCLYAKKDIDSGEELTVNYDALPLPVFFDIVNGFDRFSFSQFPNEKNNLQPSTEEPIRQKESTILKFSENQKISILSEMGFSKITGSNVYKSETMGSIYLRDGFSMKEVAFEILNLGVIKNQDAIKTALGINKSNE